jgi:CRISPR/Cas system CSM-associated protein Csm2 small subunit
MVAMLMKWIVIVYIRGRNKRIMLKIIMEEVIVKLIKEDLINNLECLLIILESIVIMWKLLKEV